ncbi:unnamed protein product [marine sediment metagenome]|uniref:Uncharacterized protein n=1 Tax=marine sediment metagenome TaxID=412755 RepID=X0S4L0_9ZZZZ
MIFSLQEERRDLMSYYWMYRFAFPDRSNKILEEAETIERELLSKLLADKEAFVIYHPYPVPIPTMYDAIRPLLSK